MDRRWTFVLAAALVLLLLFAPAALAAPHADTIIHTVRPGETLSSIAAYYGVDMGALARANNIINPNRIYVGQRLVIPRGGATGIIHVIQRGETLTRIAQRYGVDVWTIAQANGIFDLNRIYVGQRLVIPGVTPRPTTPPSPTTPPAMGGPWYGQYYANMTLTEPPAYTAYDEAINFNWGWNAPVSVLPADRFSVRWTATNAFSEGTYRFFVRMDDGARVWVDGALIIDQWRDGGLRTFSADRTLTAGNHDIRVEYYDRSQVARVYFWWQQIGGGPTPPPAAWSGQFFNNMTLSGAPSYSHTANELNFNWGTGSPASVVPADNFSARWTSSPYFTSGTYRFTVQVDDGARLWVDDVLIMDQWQDGGWRTFTADRALSTGYHAMRVEYYEHSGAARIRVGWQRVSDGGTPTPPPTGAWWGELFTNMELSGPPATAGYFDEINFNWETGGLFGPGNPDFVDYFSIRWTRTLPLAAGVYHFCAQADDGVRIYVDGLRVLDEWHPANAQSYCSGDVNLSAGEHTVVVEYYEEGGNAMIRVWW